jgi:hypothetical protein
MKDLSFEEIHSLNEENVLEYLFGMYSFNMESLQEKKLCAFISFKICSSFSFKIYASTDAPTSEIKEIKIHVYETVGKGKHQDGSYQMLNVKKDARFNRTEWQKLFPDDWRSTGILSTKQLLDMMKFTARLCRLRVFE